MHYPDLTSSFHEDHSGGSYRSRTPAVYVGWLAPEEGHSFPSGMVPKGLVEALYWAVNHKIRNGPFHDGHGHRGAHTCPLCESAACNYVVTIPGVEHSYYVPGLIAHYVDEHNYLPPQEFVEAVMDHWHRHNGIQESQGTRGVIRRMLHEGRAGSSQLNELSSRVAEILGHAPTDRDSGDVENGVTVYVDPALTQMRVDVGDWFGSYDWFRENVPKALLDNGMRIEITDEAGSPRWEYKRIFPKR